jgi:LmbE family N-acetylglucosaminyl deacetylase
VYALVSPHPDDVALSCALLLAANPGSHVVTVFSGGPPAVDPIPEWELASGMFAAGDDVPAARRAEDAAACALLAATAHHLGYWDGQYRCEPYGYAGPAGDDLVEAAAASLAELLRGLDADAWGMPLGLVHPDHELAAAACRRAFRSVGATERFAYLELPYYREAPGRIALGGARLAAAGFAVEAVELEVSDDVSLKRAAFACHRSQLAPLEDRLEAAMGGPETYLRLTPLP